MSLFTSIATIVSLLLTSDRKVPTASLAYVHVKLYPRYGLAYVNFILCYTILYYNIQNKTRLQTDYDFVSQTIP